MNTNNNTIPSLRARAFERATGRSASDAAAQLAWVVAAMRDWSPETCREMSALDHDNFDLHLAIKYQLT